jgi:hypothetical protein
MLLREQVLDASGAGEGHDVHRVVSRAGEGVRGTARHPGEVAGFGGPTRLVELELEAAGDHEEALVDSVMSMEDRPR